MPIYEYKCEKCNSTFEAMQAISAKPLKNCNNPSCKGKVHRLVSASGFILKGSGWYTSDYPSEARKKGWESENKQSTSSANSSASEDVSNKKTPTSPTQAPTKEKAAIKPTSKISTPKNPYAGSKKPRNKISK